MTRKTYGLVDLHPLYKAYHKYMKIPFTRKTMIGFFREVFAVFTQYIFEGNVVQLPKGFGTVFIRGTQHTISVEGKKTASDYCKSYWGTMALRKELKPDWTNEDWKRIPAKKQPQVWYGLEHTNGIAYRISWVRDKRDTKLARLLAGYEFNAVYTFKKRLIEALYDGTAPTYFVRRPK